MTNEPKTVPVWVEIHYTQIAKRVVMVPSDLGGLSAAEYAEKKIHDMDPSKRLEAVPVTHSWQFYGQNPYR